MPINESSTLTDPQRAWVDALQSGKYKQTKNVLCALDENGKPVGFCCLGVACEVALAHGIALTVAVDELDGRTYDGSVSLLPEAVRGWLGVSSEEGRFRTDTGVVMMRLTTLNDTGSTFEEIAALIESQPDGLFARDES